GPAGITLAEALAQSGIAVLLLDSGTKRPNRRSRNLLRGESVGYPLPVTASRERAFGGTSSHWTPSTGLRLRPLATMDFDRIPGIRDIGWPFRESELRPYVRRASDYVGVRGSYAELGWSEDSQTGRSPSLTWEGGPELAIFRFADHRVFVNRLTDIARSPHI